MIKDRHFSIGEVVRETGLTERSLRFYEQRGLISPIRAANGRRAYSATDLLHIGQIVLLKRAGFSLKRIADLVDAGEFDALSLIDIQLESLALERRLLDDGIRLLQSARDVLAERDHVDVATLCEFIRLGERNMTAEAWQKIYDKYYSKEEQAHWKRAKSKLAEDFDQTEYSQAWQSLNDRIKDALPLEPSSEKAREFMAEWDALLKPFLDIADSTMLEGASRLWAHQDEWRGDVKSPLSPEVWAFMTEVRSAAAEAREQR